MSCLQLQRSAVLANRLAEGCLERLARSLSQLGHSVYLTGSLASASAAEGSFETLRHKFLTVITNGEGTFVYSFANFKLPY